METERDHDMCDPGKLSDVDRKGELRCECGSLMALIKKEGIELKCRRCKRKSLIPLNSIAGKVRKLWSERLRSG